MTRKQRTRKRLFLSLNVKFSFVLVLAALLTIGMFMATTFVEEMVTEREYTSPEAVRKNQDLAFSDLEKFIQDKSVAGTDVKTLQAWINRNDYTYLYVWDNQKSYYDGGWQVASGEKTPMASTVTPADQKEALEANLEHTEKDNQETLSARITPETFVSDLQNRIVVFADGPYYVYINVYKQQHWNEIMNVIRLVLCAVTAIAVLLLYNARILGRIIRLSALVKKISDGDLHAAIVPTSNDEIGRLAGSVDTMRTSILEKLQNEKQAWDANTQLITAMSHDIRTPLTSLIGYLDIIQGGKYESTEEMVRYIESSRDKAFQLRDLSDKLFQYFLVFGSAQEEKELEVFDAGILIQQLISEHTAELINYGYIIDFEYGVSEVQMKADLSSIRRLFDNLFSNIMKYGDKKFHVSISAVEEEGRLVIRLLNSILESSKKVESNNIGLKTCEKICLDMGGHFAYSRSDQLFTARIDLPIFRPEEEPEATEDGAEADADAAPQAL